jgi:hypothetical protein
MGKGGMAYFLSKLSDWFEIGREIEVELTPFY